MGIQIQGNGGVIADVWGTGFRGLKTHSLPFEYGANGHYRKSLLSGTMAAGLTANSEVWQFRWSDATRLGVITKVILDGLAGSATAFTAGFGKIDVLQARSFTASGSGGTAGTLTGNNSKTRTSMGTTLVGDIRIASTAALGAGTKTNDTDPMSQFSFTVGTVVSATYAQQVLLIDNDAAHGQHPIVLVQNEGLAMRATLPATGTWQFGVSCCWAEVDTF
jgi:hypothetical protein